MQREFLKQGQLLENGLIEAYSEAISKETLGADPETEIRKRLGPGGVRFGETQMIAKATNTPLPVVIDRIAKRSTLALTASEKAKQDASAAATKATAVGEANKALEPTASEEANRQLETVAAGLGKTVDQLTENERREALGLSLPRETTDVFFRAVDVLQGLNGRSKGRHPAGRRSAHSHDPGPHQQPVERGQTRLRHRYRF